MTKSAKSANIVARVEFGFFMFPFTHPFRLECYLSYNANITGKIMVDP